MRQNVQSGIARRDEQQLEQTLRALAALVQLYQGIDYSSPCATKHHAHLAAAYLADAVQDVVPNDMVDVLLEGVRLMGRSARHFIVQGKPDEVVTLTQKIAAIACTGCAKENYRPITMEGMTQLAFLTSDVVRIKSYDIRFAIGEIRKNVALVSNLFLKVSDTPLSDSHNTYLGPYYSSTCTESLKFRLTALVDALSREHAGNEDAKSVIWNMEQWADGLHETSKALLLAAIDAKSHFTITMIQWITGVTGLLLTLSNAPACDSHTQKKLRKHARWLIAALSWIPDDRDSVEFVERFQLTEALFKAATSAQNRGCEEVSKEIGKDLLSWAFKGGRYNIKVWQVLERGLCGCAAFVLMGADGDVDALKTDIRTRLREDRAPEREVLERVAREIRHRADSLPVQGHWSSSIEVAMTRLDYSTLSLLLDEIADILSPPAQ